MWSSSISYTIGMKSNGTVQILCFKIWTDIAILLNVYLVSPWYAVLSDCLCVDCRWAWGDLLSLHLLQQPSVLQRLYDEVRSLREGQTNRLVCSAFLRLPNRKSCPQYYECIATPMDLTRIQVGGAGGWSRWVEQVGGAGEWSRWVE